MSGYFLGNSVYLFDSAGTPVGMLGRDGREWAFPAAMLNNVNVGEWLIDLPVLYDPATFAPVGFASRNGSEYFFPAVLVLNTVRGYSTGVRSETVDSAGTPLGASSGKVWSWPAALTGGVAVANNTAALDITLTSALPAQLTYTGPAIKAIQAGVLTSLGVNAPAFESWDSVNRGLLLFPATTNLLPFSNVFANAAWTKTGITSTAGTTGPDGVAASSTTYTESATTDSHSLYYFGPSMNAGQRATWSMFVRQSAGNRRAVKTILSKQFGNVGVQATSRLDGVPCLYFLDDTVNTTAPWIRSKKMAGGWYRYDVTVTWPATGGKEMQMGTFTNSEVAASFLGAITNAYEYYGGQLEVGGQSGPYIDNPAGTTNSVTASACVFNTLSWFTSGQGTFIIDHDCDSGTLIGSGANVIATASAPGRTAISYDGTSTLTASNGGAIVTTAAPTFGADIRLLGTSALSNTGRVKRFQFYNSKVTGTALQALSVPARTSTASAGALRTVAVQNRIGNGYETMATTVLDFYTRFPFSVVVESNNLKVAIPNFEWQTNNTNAITVLDASLERITGVNETVPIKWAGARTVIVPIEGAAPTLSDAITASQFTGLSSFATGNVKTDFFIKMRCRVTTAGFTVPIARSTNDDIGSKCRKYDPAVTFPSSTDAIGQYTETGAAAGFMAGNFAFTPVLLGVPTTDGKSIFAIGDSILAGTGGGLVTQVRKACTNLGVPLIEFVKGGMKSDLAVASTHWYPYLQYSRIMVDELGTNSFAVIQDAMTYTNVARTTYNYDRIIHLGLFPETTSTDGFATEANQTVRAQNFTAYNANMVQLTAFGIYDLNINPIAARGANPDKWISNGTANFYTSDGIHPTAAADDLMVAETQAAILALTVT